MSESSTMLAIRPEAVDRLVASLDQFGAECDELARSIVEIKTLSGLDSNADLLFGAAGELGLDIARHCRYVRTAMEEFDITGSLPGIHRSLGRARPHGAAEPDRNVDEWDAAAAGTALAGILALHRHGHRVDRARVEQLYGHLPGISWREMAAIEHLMAEGRSGEEAVAVVALMATHVHDPFEHGLVAEGPLASALGLDNGDTFDLTTAVDALASGRTHEEQLLFAELSVLLALPRSARGLQSERIAELRSAIHAVDGEIVSIDGSTSSAGAAADSGGYLDVAVRAPVAASVVPTGATNAGPALGGAVIADSFGRIGDNPARIRDDEMEIVVLEDGRVIATLGGIVLTPSLLLLDSEHSSARNLGVAAQSYLKQDPLDLEEKLSFLPDATPMSPDVEANGYARAVTLAFERAIADGTVAPGADVLLNGFSHGADTVVDLALDPYFNGELVNVTHVVASGYANDRQACNVPEHTSLLTMNNRRDVVVAGEELLEVDMLNRFCGVESATGQKDVLPDLAFDTIRAEGAPIVDDVAQWAADGVVGHLFDADAPDLPDLAPGMTAPATVLRESNSLLVEFTGSGQSWHGHDRNEYVDGINQIVADEGSRDAQVILEQIGEQYSGAGIALAVDVSLDSRRAPFAPGELDWRESFGYEAPQSVTPTVDSDD